MGFELKMEDLPRLAEYCKEQSAYSSLDEMLNDIGNFSPVVIESGSCVSYAELTKDMIYIELKDGREVKSIKQDRNNWGKWITIDMEKEDNE